MSEIDFETVYHENFKIVYGYLYSLCQDSHLAEELTQETFFKALKSIHQYQGRAKIHVWLCEIGKNTYFTHCAKSRRVVSENERNETEDRTDSLLEKYVKAEEIRQIHQILHNMEEPYKEIFSLRIFGELPFRDIGRLFGKTESWARVTYYRAKQRIMREMEELHHE